MRRQVVSVFGLPFDIVTLAQAEALVREAVRTRRRLFVSTPNLNFVVAARSDPEFRRSVFESDLSLADGMPIVWASRLLRLGLPERVAGSDLFDALVSSDRRPAIRVYFFGGEDGAADAAMRAINGRACGVTCVGAWYPGFGSIDDMSRPEVLASINEARPDFLVVSIGAKRGQAWILRNRALLDVPVVSYLGAVINFQAGRVSRAPPWMSRLGVEWAWRVLQEPSLVRRYASDGASLCRLVVHEVLPQYVAGRRPAPNRVPNAVRTASCPSSNDVKLSGPLSRDTAAQLDAALAAMPAGLVPNVDASAVDGVDAWGAAELAIWLARRSRDGASVNIVAPSAAMRRDLRRLGCEDLLDFR